jgi:hypothetical protein
LLCHEPDRSETQSPTGSMRTIRSMACTSTHSGSAVSSSRSTTFLPSMICLISSLFRDLAQGPCLANHIYASALLMVLRSPTKPSSTLENHELLLLVAAAHYGVQRPWPTSARNSNLLSTGQRFTIWIGLRPRTCRCHHRRRFSYAR